MSTVPIPIEALEDNGAVLGKRGAGKSNSLMVLLEHELDAGHRSVMIDPKGDRWGVRMNPDRSPSRFDLPIFGGKKADYELTPEMGETMGRMVAENDVSCLIDLSLMSLGGKQEFMMGFAPTLLLRNRAPVTLFIEEVHQFANMDLRYQPPMLIHHIANFGTLGRTAGIVMWMASQRPAQVNATVRSQADTIIGHKVTSPLDRDALRDWFKGAGKDFAKRFENEAGSLSKGEAFVWVSETGFLDRVQFPMATTYDSGRTPKHGETIDDVVLPKLTNAAIADLLAAVAKPVEELEPGPIVRVDASAEVENLKRRLEIAEALKHEFEERWIEANEVIARYQEAERTFVGMIADIQWPTVPRADGTMPTEPRVMAGVKKPVVEAAPSRGPDLAPPVQSASPPASALPRRVLEVMAALAAVHPKGLSEKQWAARAGVRQASSTWRGYRAKMNGLVEKHGDDMLWHLTPEGLRHCAGIVPTLPPPGLALVEHWAGQVKAGAGTILRELAKAHPHYLHRSAMAEVAETDPKLSTFRGYIADLNALGLIRWSEGKHGARIAPELMEAAYATPAH